MIKLGTKVVIAVGAVGIFLAVSPFTFTHDFVENVKIAIFGIPVLDQRQHLKYGRNHLEKEEQQIYDRIYNGIEELEEFIPLSSTPLEEAKKIYGYYLNDTPEHFYIQGISFRALEDQAIGVEVTYQGDKEEIKEKKQQILEKVQEIAGQISGLDTSYQKSKGIYDYVVSNVAYEETENSDIYTVKGAFLDGKAVCQGYGKAYQYIANQMGMEAIYVRGMSRGENHGWNIVKFDENYYHIDTTWADIEQQGLVMTDYSYLHLTEEEIQKDHMIDIDKNYPLPKASSLTQGYYLRNNLLIGNYKEEKEKLETMLISNFRENKFYLDVKFLDQKMYNEFAKDNDFHSALLRKGKSAYEEETGKKLSSKASYSIVKNQDQQTIKLLLISKE